MFTLIKETKLMKAIIFMENNESKKNIAKNIAKNIEDSEGVTNVEFTKFKNTFAFNFSTHNAMEGLREKLVKLGYSFKLKY